MSDPIERQAAKEAYCKKFCHPGVLCPDSGFCREVDEAFDPVPSAQPLVIHCTDCEGWHERQSILGFAISQLPSAQPEPLLDEVVDEIRKTIAETESNGKYHADPVRHNGEMICHGLQIALNIIEEKRNERSD